MVPADELKILRTAREKRDAQQSSFTAVEAVVLFRANFWRTFAHEDPETSGPKARERAAARVRELVVGPFDGDFAQAVDYLRWIILRWKRSQDPDTPVKERPFVSGATPSIATITKPGSYFVREYLADRNRGDSDQ